MPNIPVVAFDAVESLGSQNGSASLPPRSEEDSFDSFLKDAGNSLEEFESDTVSPPRDTDKAEPPNASVAETDHSDETVQASSGESQDNSGQIDDGESGEPASVSGESHDESEGQAAPNEGDPVNSGDGAAEKGLVNIIPGGGLPFPQLVEPGIEVFEGQSIGVALASGKSGISLLGNGGTSNDSGKAAGGAPGAAALNRQLEMQAGVVGQSGGAKSEVGNQNNGNAGTGLSNAQEHVPVTMPAASPFGDGSEGEESSAGMIPQKSASPTGKAQNANANANLLTGREVSELAMISPEGKSIAVAGNIAAMGDDALAGMEADDAPRPVLANANAKVATSQTGNGSGSGQDAETAQDNDMSEILQAQFRQPGDSDPDNVIVEKSVSTVSGPDTEVHSQESHSLKAGPQPVSLDGKANPEIQTTAEIKEADAPLRARVQEQVLDTAVARVSLAIRDKVSHARIRLDPPSLGRMDMELRVEDGTLTAKVKVESVWVKEAITTNLKELHDALEEHGVKVEEFSVDVDAGMDSWMSDQAFDGEDSGDALYLESDSLEEEDTVAALSEADSSSDDGSSSTLDLFA